MKSSASKGKRPLWPSEIGLPERELLEGGAMFVRMTSCDELEKFWIENRHRFQYAAYGVHIGWGPYLGEDEWIFAPDKRALVKAVFRWDRMGIRAEFYDWSKDDPDFWLSFFADREEHRARQIAAAQWTEQDEAEYRKKSMESYKGWWRLVNLPGGLNDSDWFGIDAREISEPPNASIEAVTAALQEATFDDWKDHDGDSVRFVDGEGVLETIAYWREDDLLKEARHSWSGDVESRPCP